MLGCPFSQALVGQALVGSGLRWAYRRGPSKYRTLFVVELRTQATRRLLFPRKLPSLTSKPGFLRERPVICDAVNELMDWYMRDICSLPIIWQHEKSLTGSVSRFISQACSDIRQGLDGPFCQSVCSICLSRMWNHNFIICPSWVDENTRKNARCFC